MNELWRICSSRYLQLKRKTYFINYTIGDRRPQFLSPLPIFCLQLSMVVFHNHRGPGGLYLVLKLIFQAIGYWQFDITLDDDTTVDERTSLKRMTVLGCPWCWTEVRLKNCHNCTEGRIGWRWSLNTEHWTLQMWTFLLFCFLMSEAVSPSFILLMRLHSGRHGSM